MVQMVKPSVELLAITLSAEQLIELAGRRCYKSEDKITADSAAAFVQMLAKRKHVSVIEHASATFAFVCNRGVSHEMVRHRLCSFSQESTRYCNYGKSKFGGQIKIIEQKHYEFTPAQWARRAALYEQIEEVYMSEIAEGVPAQIARDNLPICLKTEIVMTCNLREWMHVLTLRTSPAAHPQIRELMTLAGRKLKEMCPSVFAEFDFGSGDVV